MRIAVRSLLAAAALALATCAAPPVAFAKEAPHPDVVDAVNALSTDAPFSVAATSDAPASEAPAVPAIPEAPAPNTDVLPEEERADPRHALIDGWFAKHFHGLGSHLTEYLHSRLLAAKEDLKDLILSLPIS